MPAAPLPLDETARLAAVARLGLMGSAPSEEFNSLARVASLVCGTRFALIGIIDEHRQWMTACIGLPNLIETPRDLTFCGHVILADELVEVEDASKDPRFSDNPAVTGGPGIRFYAGMPVCTQDGSRVGTICVVDTEPRRLTDTQRAVLRSLATATAFAMEGWHARDVQVRLTERLGLATADCGIGIWEHDLVANRVDWDATTYKLYGLTPKTGLVSFELWQRHIHPDDFDAVQQSFKARLASADLFVDEFRVVWADGSVHHLHNVGLVRRDADGQPLRIIGSNWDVTERVAAQEALRVSEERLRLLVDGVTDHAIYLLDADGNVTSWNTGAAQITRYQTADIIGCHFSAFSSLEDIAAGVPAQALALAQERGRFQQETWRRRKDGTLFWGRVSISAVLDTAGRPRGFAVVTQDLTEQRLTEQERAILIEAAPNGMMITNEQGIITLANAQAETLLGYPAGSLKGQEVNTILSPEDQAARVKVRTEWAAQADLGVLQQYNFHARRADGSLVPIEGLLRPVRTPDGFVVVTSMFDATERLRQQHESDDKNAAERAASEAVKERLERLARHLGKARDQAQRANEAKSRFLAAISHELRTPLNGILGYAQLLQLEGGLQPKQADQVGEMLSAGEHLLGMINAVLDLSQIESDRLELQPVLIDLPGFAQKCLSVVRPAAAAKSLKLSLLISADAPTELISDQTRLRQILVNLLGNAVKFTPSGGAELRVLHGESPGRVRVEVADTGPGIPPTQRERLFREFSRLATEEAVAIEGSGLGLAITARLVQRMGGQIGFTDNRGGGSVFWFELPVGDLGASSSARTTQRVQVPCTPQTLRILVVDDVDMNRKIAKAFLLRGGHHVEGAGSGEAAVAAVAAGSFDVVMMDVQMPGMDGLEATRHIRALPGAPGQVLVMAMTAQAFVNQIDDCIAAGMNGHVSKPLECASLLEAVARAHAKKLALHSYTPPPPSAGPPLLDEAVFRETGSILAPEDLRDYLLQLLERGRGLQARLSAPDMLANADLLSRAVHALRGTAGTFGFRRLDAVAAEFEYLVDEGRPGVAEAAEALVGTLRDSLTVLEALAARRIETTEVLPA